MPIFLKFKVPVSFYIPTKYIDSHAEKNAELSQLHPDKKIQLYFDDIEFLSWKDCQQIVDDGMNIGSHTVNHVTLSSLSATGSKWELSESKKIISLSCLKNDTQWLILVAAPSIECIVHKIKMESCSPNRSVGLSGKSSSM